MIKARLQCCALVNNVWVGPAVEFVTLKLTFPYQFLVILKNQSVLFYEYKIEGFRCILNRDQASHSNCVVMPAASR